MATAGSSAPVISGGDRGADAPQHLLSDTRQLLNTAQQLLGQKGGLPPELLGRLEGLLARLQLPASMVGENQLTAPALEAVVAQLSQLVSAPMTPANGEPLGFLSQLFGFYLEAELLQDKKAAALASLKASLLSLQKEQGGDEVREPLRRIELFQLCKARFAEEQILFLPLPFNELEEGYLLAERQAPEQDDDDAGTALQMSLSLRLSALGNVRIDMFYDHHGLQLRVACENQEKKLFLQDCADELVASLQAVEVRGISFSADAKLPARQLQQRLLPESFNMLDTRI